MGRIYYYKLTADSGGAPCAEDGILSLAICKPRIRTGAQKGDWIFGFAGNSLDPDNRLIYIAEVTDKEIDGRYYRDPKYSGRSDRIYRWEGDRYERRARALYHDHDQDLTHDLGEPPTYPRAQVLLSKEFRYLGVSGTADYKAAYPLVGEAITRLGRGERVNHSQKLRGQLISLKDEIWHRYHVKVCGKPHQPPDRTACHRARSCGVLPEPVC